MRISRRRVLAASLVVPTAALAAGRGGAPPATPPSPPLPQFTHLSLSNFTWTTSGAAVTIGSIVALTDIPATLTGATLTVSDTKNFQFTNGGVYPCALQAKAGVTAGVYSGLTMTIDLAGIGNTPYTQTPAMTLTGSASSGQIALVRTVNNAGAGTPAIAFWNMGHPFIDGDVPSGSIVSAKLGGTTVPVQGFCTKLQANGSFAWSDLHVDLSGAMPGPGASADLVLSVVAGSWSATTNRTDADWAALVDTVEITNLSILHGDITSITWSSDVATVTTTAPHGMPVMNANLGTYNLPISGASPSGYNTPAKLCTSTGASTFTYNLGTDPGGSSSTGTYGTASAADLDGVGTWVASFDAGATNIIWPYGSGALGLRRRVTAPFYNGATKHRFLMAVMEYWCTQKGDGTLGPIMSIGPIIENALAFKTAPNQFNYDIAFKRNGSVIRSESGVQHPALSKMVLTRWDGLGDWTASDPSIWVSQDYNLLGATKKLPNYADGINYVGPINARPTVAITGINTSTGVFTAGAVASVFGPVKRLNPVVFTAGSLPTGLSAATIYWAVYLSATTFQLYDTLGNAITAGATGKVIPSTSGSAVVLRLAAGPTATGLLNQGQGSPGSFLDLCVIPEWHAAYVVANTQNHQLLGRTTMYAWMSAPVWLLKDDTPDAKPHVVSCLTTALTPVGLRPAKQTSKWIEQWSSDINDGNGPFGGKNVWGIENSHMTSPVYVTWLLEGGAIFQSVCVEHGARAIGEESGLARRNTSVSNVAYSGIAGVMRDFADPRACAWVMDAVGMGAFAATQGSDEETMLRNVIDQNATALSAYIAFKSTPYSDTGCIQYHEATYPPNGTGGATHVSSDLIDPTFMHDYSSVVWPFISNLNEEYVPSMTAISTYMAKRWLNAYNGQRGFYATAYRHQYCISDGNALVPAVYEVGITEVGLASGDDARFGISLADGTMTMNASAYPVGWTISNGDKFRPCNFRNATGNPTPIWPAPFVDGTDYFFVNVNLVTNTAQLASTSGGTPIVPTEFGASITKTTTAPTVAGSKILLIADTSQIYASPGSPAGAMVTDNTAPSVIPAGAYVASIVPNVSVTLSAAVTGAGVGAGDSITFKVNTLSGYFIPTVSIHGNPNTGTSAATTNEDSYLATQIGGLALHADRGVSGADTAYNSAVSGSVGALPRYTGNNNLEAMWAYRRL